MSFRFNDVERLIVGTVGLPGEREFFLQVRTAGGVKSFKIEKGQAAALAERMREILREVRRRYGLGYQPLSPDDLPLDTPVESEFAIGSMSLTWEESSSRIVFEGIEIEDSNLEIEGESEVEQGVSTGSSLEARITLDQAAEFVRRTFRVVEAGRKPCTFCGAPLDPSGHLCPRANGYRR